MIMRACNVAIILVFRSIDQSGLGCRVILCGQLPLHLGLLAAPQPLRLNRQNGGSHVLDVLNATFHIFAINFQKVDRIIENRQK